MHQPDNMQMIPNLSDDKLLEFLLECLNLGVSKEELAKPKAETVTVIYEKFLKDFGFNVENLVQPYWQAAELFDSNLEHYEDTLAIANLLSLMRYVAEKSGIHDFSLKDIMEPERKRTRHILSCLANYWQFSGYQLQKWLKIKEEYAAVAERTIKLKREIEEKTESLHRGRQFLNEVAPEREEMDKQYKRCIEALMHEKERKEKVTEEYHAVKQEAAEAKRDLNNVTVEISSLLERKKELEAKIVSSDQRKELKELAQKSQLYRKRREEIQTGIDEYNNLKGLHARINNELDIASELLDNTIEATIRNRDVSNEIEVLRSTVKADEEEVTKLAKQCEQKCLESKTMDEWTQKKEMKHKMQTEEIKKLIIEQERFVEDLQKKTGSLELEVEKESLLKDMKEHAAEREEFEETVKSKFLQAAECHQKFATGIITNIQNLEDELQANL